MLANDLPAFHRWFLNGAVSSAPGIVLHGFPELKVDLAAAVASHLNEFDDDAAGNWSAFTPGLIQTIAETPTERGLLSLGEACNNCPPGSPCARRKVLAALANRGRAVLDGPLAVEACAPLANIFRVSLSPVPFGGRSFHLVLNPELFSVRSMPAIIGDTYLEWAATLEMADTV